MTTLFRPRLQSSLVLGMLVFGLLLAVAASAQPTRSSFPTPVRFDTESQSTRFYLHLDHESPQLPLSQLAMAAGAGSAEAFAEQVVLSLVSNDLAAFSGLADPNGEAVLPEVFSRYATVLAATPDPVVRDIFYLGGLRYVVLETSHPEAPIAPLPILVSGSEYVHAFSLMLEPVVQNVSALARNRKLFPGTYGAVASPNFNTELALPGLFGDSAGDHPVSLRFWGHFLGDSTESNSSSAPTAPGMQQALDFFRNYRRAMERRDKESLPAFFGPRSRQKLERFFDLAAARDPKGEATWRWLQGAPNANGANPQVAKSMPDSNPRYILILSNTSFIFFKQGSETLLDYEYVRLGASGYEVVNFQRQTSLDTLLTWPTVSDDLKVEIAGP